jgi:hypothetical protein
MNAGDLDHCPDGTPGNNSCSLLCGLQKDMLGPEQSMYLVRNRSRGEGNMNQIFLGLFNRLRNRDRHFGGLPFSNPDPPLSISNNDECTKVEALSPLHDFCHSVDEDNFIFQA